MSAASDTSKGNGPAPQAHSVAPHGTDTNLDKIREILFGEHVRRIERALEATGERLAHELSDLRDDVGRRLDMIESRIKQETDATIKRLEAERKSRDQAMKELSDFAREQLLVERRDWSEAAERIGRRIEEAREYLNKRDDQLQKHIMDEAERLDSQIQAASRLEEQLRDLRMNKIDRSAFAALLSNVTAGLTTETKPKNE